VGERGSGAQGGGEGKSAVVLIKFCLGALGKIHKVVSLLFWKDVDTKSFGSKGIAGTFHKYCAAEL
jgi:hypothetical protein